ncbi:4-(cytidine 5'-diphospho)-2-C-methyl-D-erythritol kinase [Corynebacterium kozikiae]|uniref:4-(cytidine 5'-diphospho)-2-C-methyl-D-erythritol kinase n=1 Tax=Corynebacterium kozikiae TaxID=2968469 RepID=UPI00211CF4D8|nr:4-(cytidine 5'-diphospho)-2-C-methyl-D-erythritol kinase [Corynebacterium sp. 76QC2CO]MCQ9343929.1 4-(cytidine 5'-diphospho)-2-C-methyl-D-erythritol kinase [Corynebacterium sp. 76QC2CO]
MPRQQTQSTAVQDSIVAVAHAKVNLHLGVGPLREDGYHDLVTVFQALSLSDELTLRPLQGRAARGEFVQSLEITSSDPRMSIGVPADHTNLAWKAAESLYAWHLDQGGAQLPPVELELHKGIPTAGGMAGGSADAAAALRAVSAYLPGDVDTPTLLALAAELGSDVPFTLLGETCLGTGRGENLVPMMSRGTYHWALAFAEEGLSTPRVFAKLDTLQRTPRLDTQALATALISGDPREVAKYLHNDLQAAALSIRPALRKTLEVGVAAGALKGIVSGSGPTCAFLCESEAQASEVVAELQLFGRAAYASGPDLGAYVKGM